MKQDFLPDDIFQTIITHTPLVSVDLIIKKEGKILLGKKDEVVLFFTLVLIHSAILYHFFV